MRATPPGPSPETLLDPEAVARALGPVGTEVRVECCRCPARPVEPLGRLLGLPDTGHREPPGQPSSVLVTLKGVLAARLFLDGRGVSHCVVDSEAAPPSPRAWRSRVGAFQGQTDRVNAALAGGGDALAALGDAAAK